MPLSTPTYTQADGFQNQFLSVTKQRTFGLEYSKVLGKSTVSAEYIRFKLPYTISNNTSDIQNTNYITWILTENGGKAYADMYFDVFSVGWDREGERWITNLYINVISTSLSANAKEGNRLVNQENTSNIVPLPVVHIARYFGEEKKGIGGFGFGYLGGSMGASLYYQHTFKETLMIRVGLEAMATFSELNPRYWQYTTEEDGETKYFWRKNPITAGPSVALTYKF